MFTINGKNWNLRLVRPHNPILIKSNGVYTLGVTDNNLKTVFIADNLSDYMTDKVLCHELTHCICFSYEIELPLETEEWLCQFMAEHGKEIIFILDELLTSFTMQKKSSNL